MDMTRNLSTFEINLGVKRELKLSLQEHLLKKIILHTRNNFSIFDFGRKMHTNMELKWSEKLTKGGDKFLIKCRRLTHNQKPYNFTS